MAKKTVKTDEVVIEEVGTDAPETTDEVGLVDAPDDTLPDVGGAEEEGEGEENGPELEVEGVEFDNEDLVNAIGSLMLGRNVCIPQDHTRKVVSDFMISRGRRFNGVHDALEEIKRVGLITVDQIMTVKAELASLSEE